MKEKDILIKAQQVLMEDGNTCDISYYITSCFGINNLISYGIKIIKEGDRSETEFTGPITSSKDWIIGICNRLAGNLVTPMGLIYAVDDIITEC